MLGVQRWAFSAVQSKTGSHHANARTPGLETFSRLLRSLLARLGAAYHEFATEEFLVMQFLHGPLRFFDGLHLHKSKALRTLVMPVTYDLGVLHVADTVEELEEIALGRVERQIANVEPRRCDFDCLGFTRRTRLLLRTVSRRRCGFPCSFAVSKKCGQPLPECLLRGFRGLAPVARTAIVPSVVAAARTARASAG